MGIILIFGDDFKISLVWGQLKIIYYRFVEPFNISRIYAVAFCSSGQSSQ